MSKYGAKKTEVNGFTFDSKREAKRYQELLLLAEAGEISGLELQPRFDLMAGNEVLRFKSGRKATYVADFRYKDRANRTVVEDVKGIRTSVYKLKWAIMAAMGIEVREI